MTRRAATGDEWNWRGILLSCLVLPGVYLALWAVSLMSDSTRAASEVNSSRAGAGVMFCDSGKIVYPEEGIVDRLTGRGQFLCTDWRMRD